MNASNNASGAGVGVLAVLRRWAAFITIAYGGEPKDFTAAIATIESAMALPGKWREEAASMEGSWRSNMEACADELEAIFGPAPPATDAPEDRQSLQDAMREYVGTPIRRIPKDATPPAGAKEAWSALLSAIGMAKMTLMRDDSPNGLSAMEQLEKASDALDVIIAGRRLASGGGALPVMRTAFVTSQSCGPDDTYRLVFDFHTLAALQQAHHEWDAFMAGGARVGQEWQPIETAPRDETLLLLGWNRGNPANGAHIVIGSNWHGRWVDRGVDEANRDLGNTLAFIEYWQPLPAAPTPETRGTSAAYDSRDAATPYTPETQG